MNIKTLSGNKELKNVHYQSNGVFHSVNADYNSLRLFQGIYPHVQAKGKWIYLLNETGSLFAVKNDTGLRMPDNYVYLKSVESLISELTPEVEEPELEESEEA